MKIFFGQNGSYLNLDNFSDLYLIGVNYARVRIVHIRVDQLLPQLLMEQFDTLPSH